MRFIKFTFILCLVSLFLKVSVSADTFVSNDNHVIVNKQVISDDLDFDDNPDLAPATHAIYFLFAIVFAIGLFDDFQKAIFNVRKTHFIRGSPIF